MDLSKLHPNLAPFCKAGEIEFSVGKSYVGTVTSSFFVANNSLPSYEIRGRLNKMEGRRLFFSDGSIVEEESGLIYNSRGNVPLKHRLLRLDEV